MVSNLVFYQLALIALVWLFLMLSWLWPSEPAAARPIPPTPVTPPRKRSTAPKPFPGLTRKPHCDACEQAIEGPRLPLPSAPPPKIVSTRGRRRHVDTSRHFCPDADCRYGGWLGLGNITCQRSSQWWPLATAALHAAVRAIFRRPMARRCMANASRPTCWCGPWARLAEGLGIRAVARVFEVDPNTVLQWLVEAAEQLQAFSRYFLHDVRVTQVQLDELFALLSAVKDGEVSEAEAIERLSRSPHWVWAAIDPVSKLLLTIDVGDRTLAMAQRVVHQVVQVLAPGCVPLFLTDGFKEYTDGAADPLRPVGAAPTPPGHRPHAQAALDATAPAALCAGGQDRAAPASGPRAAPRGVRHAGGGPAGAGGLRLADQHGLRRAPQPRHPPACGRGWATGHHAVQG